MPSHEDEFVWVLEGELTLVYWLYQITPSPRYGAPSRQISRRDWGAIVIPLIARLADFPIHFAAQIGDPEFTQSLTPIDCGTP